jgi:hypothetical protein
MDSFIFAPKRNGMETGEFELVEKEAVAGMHFPAEEILRSESQRQARQESIDRANSLGNLEHYKVKIYFADDAGQKLVHTTIWGVTDAFVLLKQNVVLPVHRILKLEI